MTDPLITVFRCTKCGTLYGIDQVHRCPKQPSPPDIEELKRQEKLRKARRSFNRVSHALSLLAFPILFCVFGIYYFEDIARYVWWAIVEARWVWIAIAAVVLFLAFVAAALVPEEWLEEEE